MYDPIDPELLDRFLAGECSPEEEAAFRAAAAAHLGTPTALDAMRAAIANEGKWRQLADRLAQSDRAAYQPPSQPVVRPVVGRHLSSRRNGGRAVHIAAGVLIAATAGTATWWAIDTGGTLRSRSAAESLEATTTKAGERATLRLADGTRVILAPGSELRYAEHFRGNHREVWLAGEAFFEVTPDAARPFLVRTAHAVAEQLGTAFVVRAYSGDVEMRVAVREGSVGLRPVRSDSATPTVLLAGQIARVDDSGRAELVQGANLDDYFGWIDDGALVFRDAPVSDVLARLERWYDLDVRVADASLNDQTLNLSLRDETASQALDLITALLNARYERGGRVVTLFAR